MVIKSRSYGKEFIMPGRGEMCAEFYSENKKRKNHVAGLDVDRITVLKRI